MIKLSVVVPVYNEEKNINSFLMRMVSTIEKITHQYEIIFALDPSEDKTEEIIIDEIKKTRDSQRVDFDGKDGSRIRAYLPTYKEGDVRWVGTDPNCSDIKDEVGGKILAEGNDPKAIGVTNFGSHGGYAYWCIVKNSSKLIFSAHILQDKQYDIYYSFPVRIASINSTTAKKYGDRFFKQILMAFDGKKSASLNFLSEIIGKKTNTSSSTTKKDYSSHSDKSICSKSTLKDGSAWVKIDDYVREAWSRSLSMDDCNALTGRKPLSEVNKVEETSNDSSSVKSKLKELKSMLDEGLISQEQYDDKSSKILEEF